MNNLAIIGITVLLELILLLLVIHAQNCLLQLVFLGVMIAVIGLLPAFVKEEEN